MNKHTDELYMRRCIQLARNGYTNAQPNPMVGAVIVCNGRIIGEGYHVRCGEGHAEVNAFKSVHPTDEHLLTESTIYVSLEPCAHYGKTPPCADLIVSKRVKRVVVGCVDPFARVQGRGIEKIRQAGIEVTVGVLERECLELNSHFMTFHSLQRPFVTLKWAETADGFIGSNEVSGGVHISTPYTTMLCHKRRAEHQAILVGKTTALVDKPSLTVREWIGHNPQRILLGSRTEKSLEQLLSDLHAQGIQTLLVEGGSAILQSFIDQKLFDEIYVEKSDATLASIVGHAVEGVKAPIIKNAVQKAEMSFFNRNIAEYLVK